MDEVYHGREGLSIAIRLHLAMTAAEMAAVTPLPRHPAWMACHFSPYSTGLTNLPARLPKGSLLILNDRTPIHGHEPQRVCRELKAVLHRFECPGLLVDFQNPPCPEARALTAYLARHLDAPMGISEPFAQEGAAVFLPPVPTDVAVEEYLRKWAGRELWLDASLEGQDITLTPGGAAYGPNRRQDFDHIHQDQALRCHYSIEDTPEGITFHTWRTPEDLKGVLEDAEHRGVTLCVGLFQELG